MQGALGSQPLPINSTLLLQMAREALHISAVDISLPHSLRSMNGQLQSLVELALTSVLGSFFFVWTSKNVSLLLKLKMLTFWPHKIAQVKKSPCMSSLVFCDHWDISPWIEIIIYY